MKNKNGYAAYVSAVKEGVQKILDSFYGGYEVMLFSEAFQDRECDFLTIKSENYREQICLCLTTSYERITGVALEELVNQTLLYVRELMEQQKVKCMEGMISEVFDYGKIRDKLRIRMISNTCYAKYYGNAVVRPFHDMYQMISVEQNGYSIIIFHDHLREYSVSEDEIFADALRSTMKAEGIVLIDMANPLNNFLRDSGLAIEQKYDMDTLWKLSNQSGIFGSSVLVYPGALELVAEKLNDSFYVLPSSVHEVLLVRKRQRARMYVDEETIQDTIKDINSLLVDEKDQLSDFLYFYDRETKALTQRLSKEREEPRLNVV